MTDEPGRSRARLRLVPPPGGTGGGEPAAEQDPDADPYEVARTICLKLLERSARTRAELARELRRRRVPEEAAAAVLDRLTEVGLIDDEALAHDVVDRSRGRGAGPVKIGYELRRRGVAETAVADALASLDPDTLLRTARQLALERARQTPAHLPARTRFGRVAGALMRKGYPPDIASLAAREALTVPRGAPGAGHRR